MQLLLKVTAGPHSGQKILLRSGQVARVGRTEWADFSFPRDGQLADVHFAVRCDLSSAQVRALAADVPLLVNEQQVREAALQAGDTIRAGKSTFVVAFDGQAAAGAMSPAAGIGGAAAGAATGDGQPAGGNQKQEPTAVSIAEELELAGEPAAIAKQVATGPELVAALTTAEMFAKAVRVQAHILPKRLAVWWGVNAVRELALADFPPTETAAVDAAAEWAIDPSESRRRDAESAAGATKYNGPGSWLAMAVFWSGGSLSAPHLPEVPPDDKLTGQGVTNSLMIAATYQAPLEAKNRYRAMLATAIKIASGEIPIPEAEKK
ncbi:MAG: hypothetical protein MUF06_06225 [Pirellulaceae bacterium]|jgi:hypothetical protein|nr:hypothetical protein [Pirellulaceae bacterium]